VCVFARTRVCVCVCVRACVFTVLLSEHLPPSRDIVVKGGGRVGGGTQREREDGEGTGRKGHISQKLNLFSKMTFFTLL